MAKNTGRGSRSAAPTTSSSSSGGRTTTSSIWTTRSASTGRFVKAKTGGGSLGNPVNRKEKPQR